MTDRCATGELAAIRDLFSGSAGDHALQPSVSFDHEDAALETLTRRSPLQVLSSRLLMLANAARQIAEAKISDSKSAEDVYAVSDVSNMRRICRFLPCRKIHEDA